MGALLDGQDGFGKWYNATVVATRHSWNPNGGGSGAKKSEDDSTDLEGGGTGSTGGTDGEESDEDEDEDEDDEDEDDSSEDEYGNAMIAPETMIPAAAAASSPALGSKKVKPPAVRLS